MPLFSWFRRKPAAKQASTPKFSSAFGRRHLTQQPYMLPKDLEESGRLDFQHFMLRYGFQANYLAPITAPRDILDVGCGTGRWAMEVATQYPQANVIGVDIAPPNATTTQSLGFGLDHTPDNYVFVEGNVLKGLDFPDNSFDYVHMRLLVAAIPFERWPFVVSELKRVTRPGGWVELMEASYIYGGGPATKQAIEWTVKLGAMRGINFDMVKDLGQLLQGANLMQIHERRLDFQAGRWGGRLGIMVEKDILAITRGVRAPMLQLGMTTAETFDALLEQIEHEYDTMHITFPFYTAWGQKPQ